MISCITAVVERDVGAGLDLAVDVGVVGDRSRRADRRTISFVPRRRACLKNDERDRMVGGRVGAGDDRDVGVDDVAVGGRDRAPSRPPRTARRRSRRDRGGCSGRRCWCRSPRGSASGTGTPLRWSTSPTRTRRSRPGPLLVADLRPGGCAIEIERLVPARLAEVRASPRRSPRAPGLRRRLRPSAGLIAACTSTRQRALRVGVLAADQRRRQALRGSARSPSRSGP